MFEILMGASVPLAAGHESREKEGKIERNLYVKGNRDEIERTSVVDACRVSLPSQTFQTSHVSPLDREALILNIGTAPCKDKI